MTALFDADLRVVNVGLSSFADNLVRPAATPPTSPGAAGRRRRRDRPGPRLARRTTPRSRTANRVAFGRYLAAQPVLVDVALAREAIPALAGERRLLHAGPPIAWDDMCGPVQGAIAGAIVYEGWAATPDEAERDRGRREVAYGPATTTRAVGPMAGVISPSMPVWVVENATAGNRSYCNFNEGLGKVLRFGANGSP